jgi:uncharacterized membrane protein (UPF0127 family)
VRTRSLLAVALLLAVVVGAVGFVVLDDTERSTVAFVDADTGERLATVSVTVSDSFDERYTGLSNHESLGENEGMLFVHPREGDHGYVMRDMAFPIDMVFVAENGTITTIHHAELPAEGEESPTYEGYGKYVVELPYEYTVEHGIEVGDHLVRSVDPATDTAPSDADDPTATPADTGSAERPTVTFLDADEPRSSASQTQSDDADGTLATVAVTVSDNASERYTGLSNHDSLGEDEGMLFVHPRETEQGYVMRNMSFPIDMVFVAENGTITTIHHAELPPEGEESPTYEGYGKYVIELPYEYTLDHDIEVGDRVQIPEEHRNTDD